MRSAHYIALFGGVVSVSADIVSSEIHCATEIGTKSVSPVQTLTLASTSTVVLGEATTTTAVTDTITAAAVTETTTETTQVTVTQTEETVTDTYTSTSTETVTATATATESETVTQTETTTTTTTTNSLIPAPSHFVPIADTVNGFPSQQKHKRRHVGHPHCKKKTSSTAQYHPATTTTAGTDCGVSDVPTQYPQCVKCAATLTEQATATATTTVSTTITPAPITATETATITSTSTEVPRAESTVTTTETTTSTSTTTTTETSTATVTETETATATTVSYAACAANNMLGPQFNGGVINNVYNNNNGNVGGGSIYDNTQTSTAEACCERCVTTEGCTGTAWAGGRCVLLRNAERTCVSQSANPAGFVISPSSGGGFILSNGLCGFQRFAGQS